MSLYDFAISELSRLKADNELDSMYNDSIKDVFPKIIKLLSDADLLSNITCVYLMMEQLDRLVKWKPLSPIQPYSEETKDEWDDKIDPEGECIQSKRCPAVFYSKKDGTYMDVEAKGFCLNPFNDCFTGYLIDESAEQIFKKFIKDSNLESKLHSKTMIQMPYYPLTEKETIELEWYEMSMIDSLNCATGILLEKYSNRDALKEEPAPDVYIKAIYPALVNLEAHKMFAVVFQMIDKDDQIHHFCTFIDYYDDENLNTDVMRKFRREVIDIVFNYFNKAACLDTKFYAIPIDCNPHDFSHGKFSTWFLPEEAAAQKTVKDVLDNAFTKIHFIHEPGVSFCAKLTEIDVNTNTEARVSLEVTDPEHARQVTNLIDFSLACTQNFHDINKMQIEAAKKKIRTDTFIVEPDQPQAVEVE